MRYFDVNGLRKFFDELKKEGVGEEEYPQRMEAFEASIGEIRITLQERREKGVIKPSVYNKLMDPYDGHTKPVSFFKYQEILQEEHV